jgi:response regulator of citrate/malate metabolism
MEISKEKENILLGAILESLREIKEKINLLNFRLSWLEKKIEEKIPEKVLTESSFKQQIMDGNEILNKMTEEIKKIIQPTVVSKEIGIVESKKIQEIISIMRESGKISIYELAKILNLSRTRCNEYLKKMEMLGIVRGMKFGKRKYYQLVI